LHIFFTCDFFFIFVAVSLAEEQLYRYSFNKESSIITELLHPVCDVILLKRNSDQANRNMTIKAAIMKVGLPDTFTQEWKPKQKSRS